MSKILLDYVFPISQILPTPEASTAFLKQVCLVVKPKAGQEGNVGTIYECTNMLQVGIRTDNDNAEQLFAAGMSKVFILLADDLDMDTPMDANQGLFYTLLISDDFDDDDKNGVKASLVENDLTFTAVEKGVAGNGISVEFLDTGTAGSEVVTVTLEKISVSMEDAASTAQQIKDAIDASEAASALITVAIADGQAATAQNAFAEDNLATGADELSVGTFPGVIGVSIEDEDIAAEQAVIEKRSAFFTSPTNGAKNLCFAFGSLLANLVNWNNQQYITMPVSDGVDELGEANSLFDNKVSFVLEDDEFGKRLALFAAGNRAIVAPYILKNLMIDLQSRALNWISGNQPQYTLKEAALLETRLQEDVINEYINVKGWITAGVIEITLQNDNFVATGAINVAEPKALWRVFNELRQTL
jgi:hypothetical protein